jgi:PAS domain S-box-containing protein
VSAGAPAAQEALHRSPSVLFLTSHRASHPTAITIEAAFRRGLAERYGAPVELRTEYLDLSDSERTRYLPQITEWLTAKYGGHRFDAVVTHRTEALEWVLANRLTLFPGAPIVFMEVPQEVLDRIGPIANATGTLTGIDAEDAVRQSLALRPGVARAAIVAGGSEFDRRTSRRVTAALQRLAPGMEILALTGLPLTEQLRRVSALPKDSVVFVPGYRADEEGRSTIDQVVQQIAAAASVPTFGYSADWLGTGIVGGSVLQHGVLAERVAALTARVLGGEPASSIPVDGAPATAEIFDWRALQRWGIAEARLPAGSTILFRPVTLWSQYKEQVIAGGVVVGAQGLAIAGLLLERRRRRIAQAGLVKAEERYRTVADFAVDMSFWITPGGAVAYVSPSCLRLTGYEGAEFLARAELMTDLVVVEDRHAWRSQYERAAGGAGPVNFESRIRTRDGEVRWVDVVAASVMSDGRHLGVRGSMRDITSRKQSEADLRKALDVNRRLRDQLEADNAYLREEANRDAGIDGILGNSDVMGYVASKARQVASTSSTVLLLGETGVGKSLLAQAIHNQSARRARPLVTLNCAAMPATLVESELFGHERGAFTGADTRRVGRFEIAHGGTLFLDEIGELPLALQAKLLRAVQDGEFERLGSSVTLKTDVRLIVASNRDLDGEVRAGRFRQDLWYRLNIFPITVPPLRQRPEDIPMLTAHFVQKHCRKLGRPVLEVSRATIAALQAHSWPGNVRELENVVERAVILSRSRWAEITVDASHVSGPGGADLHTGHDVPRGRVGMEELQRLHIRATLEEVHWRVEGNGGAAEILGMNPNTLRSRMRKLGIQRPGGRASNARLN